VRLLGSGRFADVHLDQQRFPRRLVAVKILRDRLPTWDAVHAFELEANALAAVSAHPCIVAIHDAGRATDGWPYLVMEYCPLPTLAQQVRSGSLNVADALPIGILLAGAIDTAHAHGILHRDIKPANVLMTDYWAPQLADFGIASSAWDRNVVSGLTPAWAAPELIGDPGRASVATDVYALAATVYTMLSGHAPHEHPGGQARVLPLEDPSIPRSLADLLARALSPDEKVRFHTARQLGAALQDVERQLGLASTAMVLVDPPRRETSEQTPAMLQPLLALLDHECSVPAPAPAPAEADLLTGRELSVLHLLSEGCTATAIAHRLGISPRTVHVHLQNVYRKLGVSDRLVAVRIYYESGLSAKRPTSCGTVHLPSWTVTFPARSVAVATMV